MSEELLWERFISSGRVEDYLCYLEHKDKNNDNN